MSSTGVKASYLDNVIDALIIIIELVTRILVAIINAVRPLLESTLTPLLEVPAVQTAVDFIASLSPLPESPYRQPIPPFPFAPHSLAPPPKFVRDLTVAAILARPLSQRHVGTRKRYTLVLDLDETLVHTTDEPIPLFDARVDITSSRSSRTFYILKRPHLDVFLHALHPFYHLIVYTASIKRYADAVIDLIDCDNLIEKRLFRSSCVRSDDATALMKDLSRVSEDKSSIVLIDNSPIAYDSEECNVIPITSWFNDVNDCALKHLIPFLIALRTMKDVRSVLARRRRMSPAAVSIITTQLINNAQLNGVDHINKETVTATPL